VRVEGKERFTKVQTDLRTGRIGRMMNKSIEVPNAQIDAAVAALAAPEMSIKHEQSVARSVHSPRPSNANTVSRTVSSGEDYHASGLPVDHHTSVLAKMKLEAEYLELAKEKEVLVMRNKILELKKDLKGLREYNQQLECGHPVPETRGDTQENAAYKS
jgi:hypothetical protein